MAVQKLNVGFDYNGEMLHQVDKTRNNLVEKMLELKLKNQRIVKKAS